ncbi:hypothetical protein [Rhodopila sp.]|uniref:hypothetical protein n=1 Tax=Rhodopila sp. TaxID=2480087 RepID=UPI003D108A41
MLYSTLALTDGRFGSSSLYQSRGDADRGREIAKDWVQATPIMRDYKIDENIDGEVGLMIEGRVKPEGRHHRIGRIYKSAATVDEVTTALEEEGGEIIRSFPGLIRYSVMHIYDGRIGTFGSFDTQENARNSSTQAAALRNKSDSKIARVFPGEPEVMEATILSTYRA